MALQKIFKLEVRYDRLATLCLLELENLVCSSILFRGSDSERRRLFSGIGKKEKLVMTQAKKIEKAISELWNKVDGNPMVLIAIIELQNRRERHKGWLYEDQLPEDYDYDANFHRSEIRDGVTMFPEEKTKGRSNSERRKRN